MVVARTKSCTTTSMSARVISRGTCEPALYGSGDGAMSGQLSWSSGWSMPSHRRLVEPLRPACASCTPSLAHELWCTKSTTRFQAGTCAAA